MASFFYVQRLEFLIGDISKPLNPCNPRLGFISLPTLYIISLYVSV